MKKKQPEILEHIPMRVSGVIDDIKECTETLVRTTAKLDDIITMLSTPIFIVKNKIK